ncbi:hypothetical protein [Flexivirga meconopsidis]|uniref:hypothetical protein n=1 Tax=Flexivirga meconopsidis TaxID=2977121 RepID=UPI00223F58E7|nr:hypothetical protein [Flexivirga meconopsidis]
MNLTQQPLPAMQLAAYQVRVLDETEIPGAVAELRSKLDPLAGTNALTLAFDGTDDDAIVVTAGIDATAAESDDQLSAITLPAESTAISVRFDEMPPQPSDVWATIDAHLATLGLRTHGIHRHLVAPDGSVTLQAPVHDA